MIRVFALEPAESIEFDADTYGTDQDCELILYKGPQEVVRFARGYWRYVQRVPSAEVGL